MALVPLISTQYTEALLACDVVGKKILEKKKKGEANGREVIKDRHLPTVKLSGKGQKSIKSSPLVFKSQHSRV